MGRTSDTAERNGPRILPTHPLAWSLVRGDVIPGLADLFVLLRSRAAVGATACGGRHGGVGVGVEVGVVGIGARHVVIAHACSVPFTGPRTASIARRRHPPNQGATGQVGARDVVMFSKELRERVAMGEITVSIRLWSRPKVKTGGRYRTAGVVIEIDSIEVMPFSAVTTEDVRLAGEHDREALRARAAHAGPIDDATLVHRVESHVTP